MNKSLLANSTLSRRRDRCLTAFGRTRLMLTPEGRLEVRGGSRADQIPMREWISLFMHEAVPQFFPD